MKKIKKHSPPQFRPNSNGFVQYSAVFGDEMRPHPVHRKFRSFSGEHVECYQLRPIGLAGFSMRLGDLHLTLKTRERSRGILDVTSSWPVFFRLFSSSFVDDSRPIGPMHSVCQS